MDTMEHKSMKDALSKRRGKGLEINIVMEHGDAVRHDGKEDKGTDLAPTVKDHAEEGETLAQEAAETPEQQMQEESDLKAQIPMDSKLNPFNAKKATPMMDEENSTLGEKNQGQEGPMDKAKRLMMGKFGKKK